MNFFGIENLTLEDYRILKDVFESRVLKKNQLVFAAGETAQAFYCLERGKVRLFQTVNEQEELMAVLKEGQYFGEQAVIEQDGAYTYSASTLQETQLLVLSRERFAQLMQSRLSLGMKVILSLTRQYRETYKVGAARHSKIFSFYGPKGGAGCTTMATNFSYSLGELTAKKVLLLDLDLQYADAALLCRTDQVPTLAAVMEEEIVDADLLPRVISTGSKFDIIAGFEKPEESRLFNLSRLRTLLGLVVKRYDYIVFDLPSEVGELTETCWDFSNFVFLVISPTFAGLVHLRRVLKLMERKEYPAEKVKIVFNRYDEGVGIRKDEFARFMEHEYIVLQDDPATVIPPGNHAVPFVQEKPLTGLSEALRAFARSVVLAKSPEQKGGIFSNIKRMLLGT